MVLSTNIFNSIRKFDAYPKTLEDFRIKTCSGAIVSILSAILMAMLFISEFQYYLTPEVKEEIFVDLSRGNKLRINIDVTFPRIPCNFLSIDSLDVSGVQQINLDHSIFKRRLDLDGKPIEKAEKETKLGIPTEKLPEVTTKNETECGSCYGAESPDKQCCQNCEDIQEAYRKKGWAFRNPEEYVQCVNEGWTGKLKEQQNEGCRVYGFIDVNRVAGNFHIAPGRSYQQHHVHVHDLQPFSASQFNLTHTIHHMSFGSRAGKRNGPLDDLQVVSEQGAMMFQYYAKIVPSTYINLNNYVSDTTQFSVTRHSKVASILSGDQTMPGFFIVYELSPMMVRYTESKRSFMHFLTSVCAIVGGIFTVAGLIDSLIYHSSNAIKKKIELGKGY